MKRFLVVLAAISAHSVLFAQPVISSFSPQAALPSAQVTLSGSGFSVISDSNTVYFGAVKAVVNNAAENQLTVTVPFGASYAAISVTNGGLTGYSSRAFNPGSLIGINEFDSTSFESPLVIPTSNTDTKRSIRLYDIDGDNKQDIISADSLTTTISLIRNISQRGVINGGSFAREVMQQEQSSWGRYLAIPADFDGDRKKDLACAKYRAVQVLKNISAPGSLQFSSIPVLSGDVYEPLGVADFDGDGKVDMVCDTWVCCALHSITILRNTTPVYGNISFDTLPALQSSPTFYPFTAFETADMNGDGKPDLLYRQSNTDSIFIRINTGTAGTISFNERFSIPATGLGKIITADVDNDNKPDIIGMGNSNRIIVFKNYSTLTAFSFGQGIELQTGNRNMDMTVSDFDGDGKPEIACAVNVGYSNQSHIALFKNQSTNGNIVFANPVKYKVTSINGIAAGDIDGDGKQDLVAGCGYSLGKIAVLRNRTGESPVAYCTQSSVPDTIIFNNTLTGASYQWQVSTDSVTFVNVTNNFNFNGANFTSLTLIDNLHLWYGRQFRCMVDGRYNNIFTVSFKNTWTGAIDSTWENPGNWSCYFLPDAYTDIVIPANSNVTLSSNAACRSISIAPGATFTVSPGFALIVTH